MLCVGCEAEPVTVAHYCESCGIRLSLQEHRHSRLLTTVVDHWALESDHQTL